MLKSILWRQLLYSRDECVKVVVLKCHIKHLRLIVTFWVLHPYYIMYLHTKHTQHTQQYGHFEERKVLFFHTENRKFIPVGISESGILQFTSLLIGCYAMHCDVTCKQLLSIVQQLNVSWQRTYSQRTEFYILSDQNWENFCAHHQPPLLPPYLWSCNRLGQVGSFSGFLWQVSAMFWLIGTSTALRI